MPLNDANLPRNVTPEIVVSFGNLATSCAVCSGGIRGKRLSNCMSQFPKNSAKPNAGVNRASILRGKLRQSENYPPILAMTALVPADCWTFV